MSCEAVKTLFEVLAPSLIPFLTFNLRGTLSEVAKLLIPILSKVANSIARCLKDVRQCLSCPSTYGAI